jgi:uncharacterized protein YbaA (DUF1428 family)
MKPSFELSGIIRQFGDSYISHNHPDSYRQKVLEAIRDCRTGALGGHIDACTSCGALRVSYNSCRNRHCPKCQNTDREMWIEQLSGLLPSGNYFHVVFTVPESLNGLFLTFRDEMQRLLFHSAWQTVEQFAAMSCYLGAQTGMVAVLHTWGQTLTLHPHVHCILPEGGLNYRNEWVKGQKVNCRTAFLFPVGQMSAVFRGGFLAAMSRMLKAKGEKVPTVSEKVFNVYAKEPFGGLKGVVEYLGRYTHKTAIFNHRIKNVDGETVTFSWRDYRDYNSQKEMILQGEEFLRRFALHIQNRGYRRIRYYGIFAPSNRLLLNEVRLATGQQPVEKLSRSERRHAIQQRLGYFPCRCPACGMDTMVVLERILPGRSPPYTFAQWTVAC